MAPAEALAFESMLSTVRVVTGRVKTSKDGEMKEAMDATGMIEAQRSFRRVRGHPRWQYS